MSAIPGIISTSISRFVKFNLTKLLLHLINFTAQIVKSTCSFHDIFRNSFSLLPAKVRPPLTIFAGTLLLYVQSWPAGRSFHSSRLIWGVSPPVLFGSFSIVHPYCHPTPAHRSVSQSSLPGIPAPCDFKTQTHNNIPRL